MQIERARRITVSDLQKALLEVAEECIQRGPGYSQENVALRETAEKLKLTDFSDQQALLTTWHDLFREGKLSWGYNLDNPSPPFFHFPDRKIEPAGEPHG